ncbi:MAG: orotate phosphoribosyltransferase [Bdellovibrionota bacterium]
MDQKTSRLIDILCRVSYREGKFKLVSGKESTFYIDVKPTSLQPEGAHLIGQLAVERIKKEGLVVDGVGGLTLGADPLATGISLAAREAGKMWPAFIVRKEPKEHGTSKYIEGTENLKSGAKLLVLEDVVTTGGSSIKAVERLREGGYHPIAVLTVVDRLDGGGDNIKKLGMEFFALVTIEEIRKRYRDQS